MAALLEHPTELKLDGIALPAGRHWLTNGARLAWLIDPQRELVVVLRPGRIPRRTESPTVYSREQAPPALN